MISCLSLHALPKAPLVTWSQRLKARVPICSFKAKHIWNLDDPGPEVNGWQTPLKIIAAMKILKKSIKQPEIATFWLPGALFAIEL